MYKRLKWKNFQRKFETLDYDSAIRQFEEAIKHNAAHYSDLQKNYQTLMQLAVSLYGNGSNAVRYLRKQRPETPPDLNKERRRFDRKYNDFIEERRNKVIMRAKRRDYYKRREQAIEELIALGLEPSVDFSLTRAITTLKELESDD